MFSLGFSELYGLSVILLVIGLLIFHCAILPAASGTFEYMSAYMTTKTYLKISGIYLGMLLVVYVILIGTTSTSRLFSGNA